MSQHYDAFISYRHSPVDSRVAAQIQRGLERFHVPRAIRKRTGRRRIGPVFRDKEELPITSDLGDTITGALANSDYLIVICSPRTSESLWVQREIQTFLQTHDRRRVLTVLAEGEPQDTIPEILRSEEVVDPETGEARSVPLEPLSCDWRLPLRRARREELPRMVALLLDCAYDELRQRQRQYRMRRLTAALAAAFALALGFIGYMLRTNALIRDNYEDALRNQSRYLANESLAALEEGDRLTCKFRGGRAICTEF